MVAALTDNPGVAHLVVHRDAARDPVGDEITADVARESANAVLRSERKFDGVDALIAQLAHDVDHARTLLAV